MKSKSVKKKATKTAPKKKKARSSISSEDEGKYGIHEEEDSDSYESNERSSSNTRFDDLDY